MWGYYYQGSRAPGWHSRDWGADVPISGIMTEKPLFGPRQQLRQKHAGIACDLAVASTARLPSDFVEGLPKGACRVIR